MSNEDIYGDFNAFIFSPPNGTMNQLTQTFCSEKEQKGRLRESLMKAPLTMEKRRDCLVNENNKTHISNTTHDPINKTNTEALVSHQ